MHAIFSIHALVSASALLLLSLTAKAETADQLISKGDTADKSFDPELALKSYLPADKLDPNNVDLMLRIARQYRHLMCDTSNCPQKLKYGALSLDYAKRSAVLAPNHSEAQLSPAISYGKMLPYQGKGDQVTASPLIKVAVDRAIKLNPSNDTAWHVLGRWHQGIAAVSSTKRAIGEVMYGKLPVGTNAEAVTCFSKAVALNPGRLRHHIELGITYAQMGNAADARTSINKGLAMPNKEKDDYEEKVRGREVLASLP